MTKFKTGDIFAIQIAEGEYVSGRIMLDVKRQCIRPRLLRPGSPLGFFNGALLVETYRETFAEPTGMLSRVLIPGIFVDTQSLEEGEWQIVGHEEVNPTRVEFPEALVLTGMRAAFERGEISLPLDLSEEDFHVIHVSLTRRPSGILGDICLYYLDRKSEINNPWIKNVEAFSLKNSDLRFSEHRGEVYRLLGEDEDQPYFEMAMRHGHDVRRFYGEASEWPAGGGVEVSEEGAVTLCPYCLSPVGDGVKICPRCKQDTTRDARVVMDWEEYRNRERKSCRHCGASMLKLAMRCPACGKKQR